MPTAGEYQKRLRRRRLAAALLLAPVAGYGVQTARQRLRDRINPEPETILTDELGEDTLEPDASAATSD